MRSTEEAPISEEPGSGLERQRRSAGSRDRRGNSGTQRDSGSCGLPPVSVTPALVALARVSQHFYTSAPAAARAPPPIGLCSVSPSVTRSAPAAPLSACACRTAVPSAACTGPPALQPGLGPPPPSRSPAFCTASQGTGVSSLGDYVRSHCKAGFVQSKGSTTLVSI